MAGITLPIKAKNLLDLNGVKAVKVSELEPLLEGGTLQLDFDVILPEKVKDLDPGIVGQIVDRDVIKPHKRRLLKQMSDALPRIVTYKEADASGDKNAFSSAEGVLQKLNKYIKESTEDVRFDTRKKLSDWITKSGGIKVSAKELMTVGKTSFKEFKIARGKFANEVNYESNAMPDISKLLKENSGKWIYFALVKTNTDAAILVDKSKPVSNQEIGKLKDKMPQGKKTLGICYPEGGNKKVHLLFCLKSPGKVGRDLLKKVSDNSAKEYRFIVKDGLHPELPKATQMRDMPSSGPVVPG